MMNRFTQGATQKNLAAAIAAGHADTGALVGVSGASQRQVTACVQRLMAAGFVKLALTEAGEAALASGDGFRPGPKGPAKRVRAVKECARQRAWRSMRIRRRFTLGEVISDVERGECDLRDNLRRYMRQLAAAGYLSEVRGAGGPAYRIIRDTGPLAPVYSRTKRVIHDLNLQQEGAA